MKETDIKENNTRENGMKETDLIDLNQERALNDQIALLAKEEIMPKDLWPSIRASITVPETKSYTAKWIPWAIAASLVISLFSVTYSWNHLQQAESLYAQIEQLQNNSSNAQLVHVQDTNYENSMQYQVNLIEQEFKVAKAGLLSQISMNRSHINEKLFSDIENQLTDIEKAVVLLKLAIKSQPDNNNLPRLLTTTYQQELAVLTQLAKLDTSI